MPASTQRHRATPCLRYSMIAAAACLLFVAGITVGLLLFESTPTSTLTPPTHPTLRVASTSTPTPAAAVQVEPVDLNGPSSYANFNSPGLVFKSSTPLDGVQVTAGAWVYLNSPTSTDSMTVVSTRSGGCSVDASHRGWSFFIHSWTTSNAALVLEWHSSSRGGCGRLETHAGTVPTSSWSHVAFALTSSTAMIFLNGELMAAAPSARLESDIQLQYQLFVGETGDARFPLRSARLGHVFVSNALMTPSQLHATVRLTEFKSWLALADIDSNLAAHITLAEAAEEVTAAGTALTVQASGRMRLVEATGKLQVVPRGGLEPAAAQRITPDEPAARVTPSEDFTPAALRRGPIPGEGSSSRAALFKSGGNQWIPRMIRVPAASASGARDDVTALASGTWSDDVSVAQLEASDATGSTRADAVKAAMAHAWKGYVDHAWGADELQPRSGGAVNNWGGMGMTLIDSLDTLWVMGLKREFAAARDWVDAHLDFNRQASVSVFETTIRALGGLLAAYDLSGDDTFLRKAKDLGNRLLPAFDTPSGIPRAAIGLSNGIASAPGWTGGASILSEVGTLQVEFRYLSHATQEAHYGRKAEAAIERLDTVRPADGLYPIFISTESGSPTTSQITFGALGDSFYEYLLKVWLQGGRTEPMYRRMYDAAMDGMTRRLLKRSRPSGLLYVADFDGGSTQDKMDHLVCFVPGMLALGAYTAGGLPAEANAVRDLINAKALMYTCWQLYERTAIGISPEYVDFPGGGDPTVPDRAPFYILRPEAAESLYILHQLTGDPIYREWGWRMFTAIDKYCKVAYGYGAHPDVRDRNRVPDDRMESFFLAETLKYLYMLQSPDHTISLDKYVFNTEAHPTRMFERMGA